MQRLQIKVILPTTCDGRWVTIDASSRPNGEGARLIDVPRQAGRAQPDWLHTGFLLTEWLAAVPPSGWLQQEWLSTDHLRGGWTIETISWPMHFGRVYLRCLVDGRLFAATNLILNESPPAPTSLRRILQDSTGPSVLAIRPL